MRTKELVPLFVSLDTLSEIPPDHRQRLKRLCGDSLIHILRHFPCAIIDRRWWTSIDQINEKQRVTLTVDILKHIVYRLGKKKTVFKVVCQDQTSWIELVFFNLSPVRGKRWLAIGARIIVNGWVEVSNKKRWMVHPDYIYVIDDAKDPFEKIGVVYRLTEGLPLKAFRKAMTLTLSKLDQLPQIPEWIEEPIKERHGWPSWKEAWRQIHHPVTPKDLEPDSPARSRMAFDELLAHQLFMLRIRRDSLVKRRECTPVCVQSLLESLPFSLTAPQERVLGEVIADLNSRARMIRLIQGDVGSGKTVIAALALWAVAKVGDQTAIMAPTTLLARQHFQTLRRLIPSSEARIDLLLGSDTKAKRRQTLTDLKSGRTQIVVGTHALFQFQVAFQSLRLVVIDEQHRFGVNQRFLLSEKGVQADILFLSATPMPRTLSLALSSGIDISRLEEKPPGRSPIVTRTIPLDKIDQVLKGVRRKLEQGERVYWICPLIKESEKMSLSAVQSRYQTLKEYFGEEVVAFLHGQMGVEEKKEVINAFTRSPSSVRLLVTTTVIEVGIDIPVGVMVIEHPERFGLSQLHQLRGRIGRDNRAAYCLLLYPRVLPSSARERLKILRQTDDGFQIAEKDSDLRGQGDILGIKQSGFFRMVDLKVHGSLIEEAQQAAENLLEQPNDLEKQYQIQYLLDLYQLDLASLEYSLAG